METALNGVSTLHRILASVVCEVLVAAEVNVSSLFLTGAPQWSGH